jgi:hypothetical protein
MPLSMSIWAQFRRLFLKLNYSDTRVVLLLMPGKREPEDLNQHQEELFFLMKSEI